MATSSVTHINTDLTSCSTVVSLSSCLAAPAWLECPGLAVLLHTFFPCRHQTLISPHPRPANWLASLGHTGTPLLESFQCPSWRLLGSSLPGAPCSLPARLSAWPAKQWLNMTWWQKTGEKGNGNKRTEMAEWGRQRWERGRWVC